MEELINEKYNEKKDFRVQFFKNANNKYFYRQEIYFYDRFTSRIEWAPYSIKPTSEEFDTLEEAEADAKERVVWPDTDKLL